MVAHANMNTPSLCATKETPPPAPKKRQKQENIFSPQDSPSIKRSRRGKVPSTPVTPSTKVPHPLYLLFAQLGLFPKSSDFLLREFRTPEALSDHLMDVKNCQYSSTLLKSLSDLYLAAKGQQLSRRQFVEVYLEAWERESPLNTKFLLPAEFLVVEMTGHGHLELMGLPAVQERVEGEEF